MTRKFNRKLTKRAKGIKRFNESVKQMIENYKLISSNPVNYLEGYKEYLNLFKEIL